MSATFPSTPGGGVRADARTSERKGASLSDDTEARIARLLDRLEDTSLSERQRSNAERELDRLLADKVMQT